MKSIVKVLAGVIVIVCFAAALNGCNTIHGLGKDIEVTGEAIQDAAD